MLRRSMKRQVDRLNLKILKNDKIALMQIARAEGESMSVLVRKLIRQEIEKKRPQQDVKEKF